MTINLGSIEGRDQSLPALRRRTHAAFCARLLRSLTSGRGCAAFIEALRRSFTSGRANAALRRSFISRRANAAVARSFTSGRAHAAFSEDYDPAQDQVQPGFDPAKLTAEERADLKALL
jgi:hypothetical protein